MKGIKWVNAEISKPPINKADKFDVENGRSIRVLVWVKFRNESRPSFGVYITKEHCNKWSVENYTGDGFKVTHFAIINEPKD